MTSKHLLKHPGQLPYQLSYLYLTVYWLEYATLSISLIALAQINLLADPAHYQLRDKF